MSQRSVDQVERQAAPRRTLDIPVVIGMFAATVIAITLVAALFTGLALIERTHAR